MARKVLHGAKPAEMPAERPTRFELVVNFKTAKLFGLTLPDPATRGRDNRVSAPGKAGAIQPVKVRPK